MTNLHLFTFCRQENAIFPPRRAFQRFPVHSLTSIVPVLDAEDEVGPVVDWGRSRRRRVVVATLLVDRRCPCCTGVKLLCLLLLLDEGDVEVRVEEDGRGHEQGQRADQGKNQERLKRDSKIRSKRCFGIFTIT